MCSSDLFNRCLHARCPQVVSRRKPPRWQSRCINLWISLVADTLKSRSELRSHKCWTAQDRQTEPTPNEPARSRASPSASITLQIQPFAHSTETARFPARNRATRQPQSVFTGWMLGSQHRTHRQIEGTPLPHSRGPSGPSLSRPCKTTCRHFSTEVSMLIITAKRSSPRG